MGGPLSEPVSPRSSCITTFKQMSLMPLSSVLRRHDEGEPLARPSAGSFPRRHRVHVPRWRCAAPSRAEYHPRDSLTGALWGCATELRRERKPLLERHLVHRFMTFGGRRGIRIDLPERSGEDHDNPYDARALDWSEM